MGQPRSESARSHRGSAPDSCILTARAGLASMASILARGARPLEEAQAPQGLPTERALLAVKVAILAGGHGTRLAEETEVRPKPMVEIGGQPILWHIMKHYAAQGFKEFVIAA